VAAGELRPGLARTRTVLKHVAGTSVQAGRLHEQAARLAYHLTDYDDAMAEFEQALAIAEPHEDGVTVASSQIFMGGILLVTGEVERGSELVSVGTEAAIRLDVYPLVAEALSGRAIAHAVAGDFDSERETHLARLAVAQAHGDVARTADALEVLAEIALDEADAATARSYAEEALAIAQPGLPVEVREALIALSRAAVAEGDLGSAARSLTQAFEAAEKIGQRRAIAQCFRVAGCLAAAHHDFASAVRLFAAGHRLQPSQADSEVPVEADLAAGLETARSALGPEASAHEWTVGSSLPVARLRDLLREVVAAVPA
jgi:tetratricopeptide (TPR) repeat protein